MNGLEVILELTRTFLNVKVIAMSGLSAEEFQNAKLIGARQTFPKPLDLHAMLHAVQYELQRCATVLLCRLQMGLGLFSVFQSCQILKYGVLG